MAQQHNTSPHKSIQHNTAQYTTIHWHSTAQRRSHTWLVLVRILSTWHKLRRGHLSWENASISLALGNGCRKFSPPTTDVAEISPLWAGLALGRCCWFSKKASWASLREQSRVQLSFMGCCFSSCPQISAQISFNDRLWCWGVSQTNPLLPVVLAVVFITAIQGIPSSQLQVKPQ